MSIPKSSYNQRTTVMLVTFLGDHNHGSSDVDVGDSFLMSVWNSAANVGDMAS